jgi:hypothetical protein
MAYTTINKSSEHFNTVLWTGNSNLDSANQTITGVGFKPDLFWTKIRDTADEHHLRDINLGNTTRLRPNATAAANTSVCSVVPNSDGFVITGDDGTEFNQNTKTYVTWNWRGAGSTSSNTDGSVTSTVSANTTAGISIVKWTANLSSAVTVGHGLGTTPKVIIQKAIDQTSGWVVGGFGLDWSGYLLLESTNAFSNDSNDSTGSGRFFSAGGTEPSSTIFSTNSAALTGSATDVVAYCFAEKKGFSKFGSYQGNSSSDGTFVYTGFKPALVITKQATGGNANEVWGIRDNKRDTFNPIAKSLIANTNSAEGTTSTHYVDFVSNGFKIRTGTENALNTNYGYIYMAFAEAPLVGSNNVPCTAR